MIGFNRDSQAGEDKPDCFMFVSQSQDPYGYHLNNWVNVFYGTTRTVGVYRGLNRLHHLVLAPFIRSSEIGSNKTHSYVQDNSPSFISYNAVLSVEKRTEEEILKLLDLDSDYQI